MPRQNDTELAVKIGNRIRELRAAARVSQMALAEHLDITFQQVQKYENGKNLPGLHRLLDMAEFFEVPVAQFYEEFEKPGKVACPVVSARAYRIAAVFDDLSEPFQKTVSTLVYQLHAGEEANG